MRACLLLYVYFLMQFWLGLISFNGGLRGDMYAARSPAHAHLSLSVRSKISVY